MLDVIVVEISRWPTRPAETTELRACGLAWDAGRVARLSCGSRLTETPEAGPEGTPAQPRRAHLFHVEHHRRGSIPETRLLRPRRGDPAELIRELHIAGREDGGVANRVRAAVSAARGRAFNHLHWKDGWLGGSAITAIARGHGSCPSGGLLPCDEAEDGAIERRPDIPTPDGDIAGHHHHLAGWERFG